MPTYKQQVETTWVRNWQNLNRPKQLHSWKFSEGCLASVHPLSASSATQNANVSLITLCLSQAESPSVLGPGQSSTAPSAFPHHFWSKLHQCIRRSTQALHPAFCAWWNRKCSPSSEYMPTTVCAETLQSTGYSEQVLQNNGLQCLTISSLLQLMESVLSQQAVTISLARQEFCSPCRDWIPRSCSCRRA